MDSQRLGLTQKKPGFYQKSCISPRNIEAETGFLGPDA